MHISSLRVYFFHKHYIGRLYREDNESLRLVKLLIKNLSFQQELLSFWNQIPEKSPKNEAPY